MKRKTLSFLLLGMIFQITLFNTALFAQWESNGPYGGRMMSAVRIGNDLFAGTFGGGTGIHKSTDNGANWSLIAENMQSTRLFTDGTSLYAVSWYIMYRSDDAGATWTQISPDFGPAWASHVIDFAGNYLIYFNKNKVYRTATQNPSWADWEDVSGVFTTQNLIVSSVVVNNNIIIAGVEYPNTADKGGFYRSTDFGSTWTQVNNGYGLWSQGSLLTNRFPSVWALEYHEGTLFAGSRNFNAAPQGLWKSIDNGDSWTHVGFLNNAEPRTILSFSGNIFVGTSSNGIYKSTDGGNTWILKNGALNLHHYFLVRQLFEGTSNSLMAITDISILKSDDAGENWTVSVSGINELGIDAFGAIDETVFMSSSEGGIFKSTDNGQSWSDINPDGITALSYVKVMESILWLTNSSSQGINLTSGDNGDTWHFITPPSGNSFQSYIEHDQYLFVTTNAEDGGIARSANLGQTWETLSVNSGAASPKRITRFGDAIYVGDHNTGHIWRSTDNGQTWAATGATGFPWGAAVTGKDNYVYLSGDEAYPGIFRSSDNGLTFTLLDNKGVIEVYSDFIHQKWFDNVTNKWITKRSYNYGDTWEIVSGKFFGGNQYYLNQANGLLYAASNSQLFQSADDGNTWIALPSPPVSDILSSMMHVVGSTIYQGTQNSGLWLRREPIPVVNTFPADNITLSGAEVSGTVNPNGSFCSVSFEYGLTNEYGLTVQATPEMVTGTSPVFVTANITGLESNTTYNFRTVATNAGGAYYGVNRTFTTAKEDEYIITGNQTPCPGATEVYSVEIVTDVTYTWQFPGDWVILNGGTTSQVTVQAGIESGTITVILPNSAGQASLDVIPSTPVTAGVSIIANNNPVCSGTPVTFTASPVNGGTPDFQWYVNEAAVGANQANFSYIPGNGDQVSVVMTSDLECVTNNPAISNIIVMQVTGSCQPWEWTVTAQVHTIVIPALVVPTIYGIPISVGDWIGVFYLDEFGDEKCGGAVQWNTSGIALLAYGNDPLTAEKEGFSTGESFRWRLFDMDASIEYPAKATYDVMMPNQGNFADFGLSRITNLQVILCHQLQFQTGWNSLSSYLVPSPLAVESLFAPMINNLVIMRNLSQIYWPEFNINTIGNFNNTTGYVLKVSENSNLELCGNSYAVANLNLSAGWHYLPVLSECDVNSMELFGDFLNDIVIVQELIGTKIFWPAMNVYSLEYLQPGKAYKIKTTAPISLSFPECSAKSNSANAPQVNFSSTIWGSIAMTPATQLVSFLPTACEVFMPGDIVGAFGPGNQPFGVVEIGGKDQNHIIALFGDDQTGGAINGFTDGETIQYKLYRAATGEQYNLQVEYDQTMDNTTGNYHSNSFAAIVNVSMNLTGMDDIMQSLFSMYPNPANDVVHFRFNGSDSGEVHATIIDAKGQIVADMHFSGSTQINTSSLDAGVYFVKISTQTHTEVRKLIIQ